MRTHEPSDEPWTTYTVACPDGLYEVQAHGVYETAKGSLIFQEITGRHNAGTKAHLTIMTWADGQWTAYWPTEVYGRTNHPFSELDSPDDR